MLVYITKKSGSSNVCVSITIVMEFERMFSEAHYLLFSRSLNFKKAILRKFGVLNDSKWMKYVMKILKKK